MFKAIFFLSSFFLAQVPLKAHQPVMDMAPRWKGGYGFQLRYEANNKKKLMSGEDSVANPLGLKSEISTLWFEGVYTFTRERRVSYKVPFVPRNG